MTDSYIEVNGLTKYYYENDSITDQLLGAERRSIKAVDGITFDIQQGETFGLVGESGCGKSTTGETILKLEEPTDGEMLFDGENIYEMDKQNLKDFRQRSQIVFQDPFSSLNPRMTIDEIIREPLDIHGIGNKQERREQVEQLLEEVGLRSALKDRYPHEFSGGQRQRIAIARALSIDPDFIVLDEPVSALDVSVQAQILNLLRDLQEEFNLTFLFIAHNLGVVRHVCDRVGVMYLGELVEVGPTEEIFQNPSHPYTQALLDSVPRAEISEQNREIDPLQGDVPSPRNPPAGCRFHTRCPYAREVCRDETPPLEAVNGENHTMACYRREGEDQYWSSDELHIERAGDSGFEVHIDSESQETD